MSDKDQITELTQQFLADLPQRMSMPEIIYVISNVVTSYINDREEVSQLLHLTEQAIGQYMKMKQQH